MPYKTLEPTLPRTTVKTLKRFTFGNGDFAVESSERTSPKNRIVTPAVRFSLVGSEGGTVERTEVRKLIAWLQKWLEETQKVDKGSSIF